MIWTCINALTRLGRIIVVFFLAATRWLRRQIISLRTNLAVNEQPTPARSLPIECWRAPGSFGSIIFGRVAAQRETIVAPSPDKKQKMAARLEYFSFFCPSLLAKLRNWAIYYQSHYRHYINTQQAVAPAVWFFLGPGREWAIHFFSSPRPYFYELLQLEAEMKIFRPLECINESGS